MNFIYHADVADDMVACLLCSCLFILLATSSCCILEIGNHFANALLIGER